MTLNTEILADSPAAYWRFAEASGTTVADSIGTNTGTLAAEVGHTPPNLGVGGLDSSDSGNGGLNFPGEESYMSFADISLTGNFAVEFICDLRQLSRRNQDPTPYFGVPFSNGTDATGLIFFANFAELETVSAGVWGSGISPEAAANTKHHVVMMRSGGSSDTLEVYVDGVQTLTNTHSLYIGTVTINRVGMAWDAYGLVKADGVIDELAIYQHTLTPERIAAHYTEANNAPISSLTFELEVLPDTGITHLPFEIEVYETGTTSLAVEIEVTPDTGATTLGFEIGVYETGTTSLTFELSVYDPTAYSSPSWALSVTVGGVDLSSALTARAEIGGGEQEAALAQFTIKPVLGPIDIYSWVNKRVQIDEGGNRLFTGYVDRPVYNPDTRLTTFYCTDSMQNVFNNLTTDQIDTLLGGYHSKHIFTGDARGWDYAKEHLSTLPKAFDLDVNGVGKLTDWEAKSTPDFTFTESDILNGSLSVELAQRGKVHNTHLIDFQFRFQRLRERRRAFTWINATSFIDWVLSPTTLPTITMVREAVESTSPRWTLDSENYTNPPRSARIPVNGNDVFWNINEESRTGLLLAADLVLKKRWTQTVTESYAIKLVANQSVEKLGEIKQASQFSVSSSEETEGWDYFSVTPAGVASVSTNGDKIIDVTAGEISRVDANKAMETIQARGKAEILQSHRQNTARFKILYFPWVGREHTVEVATTPVATKGKVRSYSHVFDMTTGSALTEIAVAVSKSQSTGIPSEVPIAPPIEAEKGDSIAADPYLTELGTHIGGLQGSPAYDESWTGFTGNNALTATKTFQNRTGDGEEERQQSFSNIYPGSAIYPYQFVIPVPAVETLLTDALEAQADHVVAIAIPEDPLIMQA